MKILISLDGSKFSEAVLGPAVNLAKCSNAEVHLVEVVKDSATNATWAHFPGSHVLGSEWELPESARSTWSEGSDYVGVLAEARFQAEERVHHMKSSYLDNLAKETFPQGAETRVISGEDPAEKIIEYAKEQGFDLIALATHGRRGFSRILVGSVADKLLRSGVAPVLLVRPDKLEEEEADVVNSAANKK